MKRFSTRSNCVRAARKELEDPMARAGVHFDVIEEGGSFSYDLTPRKPALDPLELPAALKRPTPTAEEAAATEVRLKKNRKDASPERELVVRKTKAKAKPAPKTDKTATLLYLLKDKGATVDSLSKAMGWLPHTLRARLSGLRKPPHSFEIERERKDGVTTYRLVA